MKRSFLGGLALSGAALAVLSLSFLMLVPASTASAAAGMPPSPPMVIYGAAPGLGAGTTVTITNNANGASCGVGSVTTDSSGAAKYVAYVYSAAQAAGCGTNGASMSLALYFVPGVPGVGGRVATVSITWSSGGSALSDATPGTALPVAGFAPLAARDGYNF